MSAPDEVVDALATILEAIDKEDMTVNERVEIEKDAQMIHAVFGGEDPRPIYPDEDFNDG